MTGWRKRVAWSIRESASDRPGSGRVVNALLRAAGGVVSPIVAIKNLPFDLSDQVTLPP